MDVAGRRKLSVVSTDRRCQPSCKPPLDSPVFVQEHAERRRGDRSMRDPTNPWQDRLEGEPSLGKSGCPLVALGLKTGGGFTQVVNADQERRPRSRRLDLLQTEILGQQHAPRPPTRLKHECLRDGRDIKHVTDKRMECGP
jgi:hypothetical protein